MRKNLPLLSILLLSMATASAQENEEAKNVDFNRWSIDINGGVNNPTTPFADGYSAGTLNPFHVDLGGRYMFSPKFGLKLDVGYDQFKESSGSIKFDTKNYRADLQAVVNVGRMLNFETWTNTLNLQLHGGFGYGYMEFDKDLGLVENDDMFNMIFGITGQVKLTNRVALNADFTIINNSSQNYTFDGTQLNPDQRGFDGTYYTASVGLSIYLGKNEKHADWFIAEEKKDDLNDLEKRIGEIETGLADSDKDGVPDMYDVEPNSIAGVAVNSQGRSVDANQNGVPDELENYLTQNYGEGTNTNGANGTRNSSTSNLANSTGNAYIKDLINGGYVNVYFDFNSDSPSKYSLEGVNFLIKYLKANPSAKADIIGYADEIGNADYNKNLSQRRAEAVKAIAVHSGIEASRLTVTAGGEDTSVNKDSRNARQIVRRVTFKVN